MLLPPQVSEADFLKAMDEFRAAIGAENVYTEEEDVNLYRDPYSPAWDTEQELRASAAVAPKTTEEVSQIVKIANKYLIPLYAVSTGKNLGYGGTSPNQTGSVICDLKRMNKIHAIDDQRNFCIVEPGVSYFDLYNEIEATGKKVLVDAPDPGWGSLIGNALDKGVGYMMPMYRDHWNAHCGLEAVMPNGDILRTGMFSAELTDVAGDYRHGFGPNVDGLFSQGNAGIVTRMGFWMMPQPEHFFTGNVRVYKHGDMVKLVDYCNYLEDQGLCGHIRFLSPLALPANNIDPELAELHATYAGPEAFQAYADKKGIHFYHIELNFYGSRKICMAHWEYAQELFGQIEGATFHVQNDWPYPLSEEAKKSIGHVVAAGVPNMSIFARGIRSDLMKDNPSDGHVWFAPIIPRKGEAVLRAQKAFQDFFKEIGQPSPVSPASVPATWIYRSFLMIVAMYISRSNPEQNEKIMVNFQKLVDMGAAEGWYEYRAGPLFQDMVAKTYDFNGGMQMKVNNIIKDALDPNGIISPGRGGVWPARLREGK